MASSLKYSELASYISKTLRDSSQWERGLSLLSATQRRIFENARLRHKTTGKFKPAETGVELQNLYGTILPSVAEALNKENREKGLSVALQYAEMNKQYHLEDTKPDESVVKHLQSFDECEPVDAATSFDEKMAASAQSSSLTRRKSHYPLPCDLLIRKLHEVDYPASKIEELIGNKRLPLSSLSLKPLLETMHFTRWKVALDVTKRVLREANESEAIRLSLTSDTLRPGIFAFTQKYPFEKSVALLDRMRKREDALPPPGPDSIRMVMFSAPSWEAALRVGDWTKWNLEPTMSLIRQACTGLAYSGLWERGLRLLQEYRHLGTPSEKRDALIATFANGAECRQLRKGVELLSTFLPDEVKPLDKPLSEYDKEDADRFNITARGLVKIFGMLPATGWKEGILILEFLRSMKRGDLVLKCLEVTALPVLHGSKCSPILERAIEVVLETRFYPDCLNKFEARVLAALLVTLSQRQGTVNDAFLDKLHLLEKLLAHSPYFCRLPFAVSLAKVPGRLRTHSSILQPALNVLNDGEFLRRFVKEEPMPTQGSVLRSLLSIPTANWQTALKYFIPRPSVLDVDGDLLAVIHRKSPEAVMEHCQRVERGGYVDIRGDNDYSTPTGKSFRAAVLGSPLLSCKDYNTFRSEGLLDYLAQGGQSGSVLPEKCSWQEALHLVASSLSEKREFNNWTRIDFVRALSTGGKWEEAIHLITQTEANEGSQKVLHQMVSGAFLGLGARENWRKKDRSLTTAFLQMLLKVMRRERDLTSKPHLVSYGLLSHSLATLEALKLILSCSNSSVQLASSLELAEVSQRTAEPPSSHPVFRDGRKVQEPSRDERELARLLQVAPLPTSSNQLAQELFVQYSTNHPGIRLKEISPLPDSSVPGQKPFADRISALWTEPKSGTKEYNHYVCNAKIADAFVNFGEGLNIVLNHMAPPFPGSVVEKLADLLSDTESQKDQWFALCVRLIKAGRADAKSFDVRTILKLLNTFQDRDHFYRVLVELTLFVRWDPLDKSVPFPQLTDETTGELYQPSIQDGPPNYFHPYLLDSEDILGQAATNRYRFKLCVKWYPKSLKPCCRSFLEASKSSDEIGSAVKVIGQSIASPACSPFAHEALEKSIVTLSTLCTPRGGAILSSPAALGHIRFLGAQLSAPVSRSTLRKLEKDFLQEVPPKNRLRKKQVYEVLDRLERRSSR